MNSPTASAPTSRTTFGRALAVFALVALGLSSAVAQAAVEVNINQDRFQTDGIVHDIGGGLRLGTFSSSDWWAYTTPNRPRTFQLSTPESASGAYTFLTASSAFALESVTVSFNGGNDTVDGWFEFWNGNTLVASGSSHLDKDVAAQVEKQTLAFHLGVTPGGSTPSMTLNGWGDVGYYNRVVMVYDNRRQSPNFAGITSFTVQSQDANRPMGVAPVAAAPVPEPGTYAMMLAGLGAIGFMTRRRRLSHD